MTDGLLPVSVVVPLLPKRELFFNDFVMPAIAKNSPRQTVIVRGPGTAGQKRNKGVAQADCPHVFFCDDDVVLEPGCLSSLLDALQGSPAAGYAYSDCRWLSAVGCKLKFSPSGDYHFQSGPFDPERLKRGNYIPTMSLVRKELFPGFDEEIELLDDWDLWLTMAERGVKGIYVPRILYTAHFLDNFGLTARMNSGEAGEAIERVKRKHNIQ
jgi:hypothetical protein